MACSKIYLVLSAIIVSHVSANYKYERLKVSNGVPWNNQYDIYEGESSVMRPCYDSHESSGVRATEHLESLSKHFPASNVKKEATEQKNLKKMIIPFYAFANKDSIKYKELLPNSGIAHCEQIKREESIGKRNASRKDNTVCYKCRDPKTKSTYERCLYNSYPEESAFSKRVERFAPTGFRYRRSNLEENRNYGKVQNPYRFTDEYFTDATYDVPAAYENKEEKCDKIVKDSMVCMVCKDAKTNSKYEQCSYVKQPRDKAYSYTKSSSSEKPQQGNEQSSDFKEPDRNQEDRTHSTAEESSDSSDYSYPNKGYLEKISTASKQEAAPSEADCKQVEKDSKTCTVCKDPKNGGTYEKCVYNYQPSDKLYKYSRSKSFGYPENLDKTDQASVKSKDYNYPESSESTYDYSGKSKVPTYLQRSDRIVQPQATANSDNTSHDYDSDYPNHEESSTYQHPSSTYQYPSSNENDKESYTGEATSSGNIDADHCEKVQKDSMTCTICKDPKTGNDFEQCSYSYQPSDKLFSYTKSSSFGSPSKTDDKSQHTHETSTRENEQPSSNSYENSKISYDKYVPGETYEASTADEAKSEDDAVNKKMSGTDVGYFNTAKKKAEIEAFMQNFQKEDRSKCKKIMRDKMTCYQCIDKDGFQKEECAFVTGQEPDKQSTQLAFHEVKELQIDPASRKRAHELNADSTKEKVADPVEPSTSASGNSYVRLKKSDNDYPDEASHTAEETKEAEPYDYTSETRSVYDEVLGMTLPAYMFATSEHEAAFDEVVASSHDQR